MNNFLNYVSERIGKEIYGTVADEEAYLYFKEQKNIYEILKNVIYNSGHILFFDQYNNLIIHDKLKLLTSAPTQTISNVLNMKLINNNFVKKIKIKWKENILTVNNDLEEKEKEISTNLYSFGTELVFERIFKDVDKQLERLKKIYQYDEVEVEIPISDEVNLFETIRIDFNNKSFVITIFSIRINFISLKQIIRGKGNVVFW